MLIVSTLDQMEPHQFPRSVNNVMTCVPSVLVALVIEQNEKQVLSYTGINE